MSTEDTFDITDAPESPELDYTLLKMWTEVLSNVDTERNAKMRPQTAISLLANWPLLQLSDIQQYIDFYYAMLDDYRKVLTRFAKEHPEALELHGEGDAVENRKLYLQIAGEWQRVQGRQEEKWELGLQGAGSYLAALSDATTFMLGSTGMIAHLDQIGITPTPEELELVERIRTEGR